jgi:hypothetical protein
MRRTTPDPGLFARRCVRHLMALAVIAPSLVAQGPLRPPVHGVLSTPEVLAFRKGFEVSIDGSPWGPARTIALPLSRCVPATTSPCAPGTPAVLVNIRFPAVANAVDMSEVLSQLGESGGQGNHYMIRPVPANARGSVCAGGFIAPAPLGNMRMAINVGNPGTPLPVLCRWTALIGIRLPGGKVELVWSDTIVAELVAKP